MTGYAEQTEQRRQQILRLALRVIDGPEPAAAVARERALIDTVTVSDVITLIDALVRQELPMAKLKTGVNRLINLFSRSLSRQSVPFPDTLPLLNTLCADNRQAEQLLSALRPLVGALQRQPRDPELTAAARELLLKLLRFCNHYLIKENVIFPRLEDKWPDYRCLAVMWSVHDDIRFCLRETLAQLLLEELDLAAFNALIGRIFFSVSAIIFREEKLLFPRMLTTLSPADWQEMLELSAKLDWPFEAPVFVPKRAPESDYVPDGLVNLGSGQLSPRQLLLMLNNLPLDITLVDANDRVRYFSEGRERIFPRNRAIIGRLVQNCHPPESVAVVEEIIHAFRSGERDKAEFWIDLPQGKVLIQYFALRDSGGTYRGVLETSQRIDAIRGLQGERRLLDWNK